MKRVAIISVLLFSSFLLLGFFLYQRTNQELGEEKIVYNPSTRKWEKTYLKDEIKREEVLENIDDGAFYNQSVLRGYFDGYDGENNILKIKSTVRFTQNSLFEIAELKLNPVQAIYCAPEKYTDPNNGKVFEVKNLTIPVQDGKILYLPTERIIDFEDFMSQAQDSTYLIIQLTQNFNKEAVNYVQKMIVIGLCE